MATTDKTVHFEFLDNDVLSVKIRRRLPMAVTMRDRA